MTEKDDRTFIISVRPLWAELFFEPSNRKSIELRKGRFSRFLLPDHTILIYATLPVAEIIGTVIVDKCERTSAPEALWKSTNQGEFAKICRSDFDDYYRGAKVASAIWVKNPELFDRPVSLARARSILGGWQPPQQIQQLTREQAAVLLESSRF
jgi:predicted transcriptional regulator